MTGSNCAMLNCHNSRRKPGVAILRVPTGDDEWSASWRNDIINVVTRDRVIDKALKERIQKKNIFICEEHFSEDQLIRCKSS